MIKLHTKLIKVDYDQIAEIFLPEVLEHSMDSSNLSIRLAGRLLVKDGKTSPLAKGVLKLLPQKTKESFAYQLVLGNRERLKEAMNQLLIREFPGLLIDTFRILETDKEVYDMIKLEITMKEIDYNSVLEPLTNKVLNHFSQKPDKSGKLAKVFLALGEAPSQMVTAAFSILPQEAKDQLLVELFTLYQEEVVDSLNHILEQQKLSAEVDELKIVKE